MSGQGAARALSSGTALTAHRRGRWHMLHFPRPQAPSPATLGTTLQPPHGSGRFCFWEPKPLISAQDMRHTLIDEISLRCDGWYRRTIAAKSASFYY